jgi:hypothetical protein
MAKQIVKTIDRSPIDSNLRHDFIRRMQRKLAIKQTFYRDGDKHRFANESLSLPVDFAL